MLHCRQQVVWLHFILHVDSVRNFGQFYGAHIVHKLLCRQLNFEDARLQFTFLAQFVHPYLLNIGGRLRNLALLTGFAELFVFQFKSFARSRLLQNPTQSGFIFQ